MQALCQHYAQSMLPFFGRLHVLPQHRRVGKRRVRPHVLRVVLSQQIRQRVVLRLQGQIMLVGGAVLLFGSLHLLLPAVHLFFQAAQSRFAFIVLLLQYFRFLLRRLPCVLVGQRQLFQLFAQLRQARFVLPQGVLLLLVLLLFQCVFALDAVVFFLLVLVCSLHLLPALLFFGQLHFALRHRHGPFRQLRLLHLHLFVQHGDFIVQLLLLLHDFLHLRLCLQTVALHTLLLCLPCAQLFFHARHLFAQQRIFLIQCVLLLLLFVLGLAQGLQMLVQRVDLLLHRFCLHLRFFVLLCPQIRFCQRFLPLQIVCQLLAVCQFGLQFAVFFGGNGLFFQFLHLARQLALPIGQALQVFARVFEARFCFAAAFFVFGHAGGFFDIGAQFFRTRFDNARNHALFDDGITARAHARAQKQIGNVAAAHGLVVDEIAGFALPRELAFDGDFHILPPCALKAVVAVVKHQLHRCARGGAACGGTVENHVLHGFAAKLLGRSLAQHPAHRVNHVRFAAAVRPDNGHQLPGHMNGGRVGKRFESGQFDLG